MRTLLSAPPTDRVGRYPRHRFQVQEIPFTLQPFMLARVLPGETLTNLFFETRVVTSPIESPIIGWKKEFFFFYVKMSDLMLEAARSMFVDEGNTDVTATIGATPANLQRNYAAAGGIDWLGLALDKIVLHWFRDEGETAGQFATADGSRIIQIREQSWMDSLTDKDLVPEGAAISGATDMGDLDRLMDAFEMLRAMGMANMTYEDWLRSNNISVPEKDENKPEMLDKFAEFQYPSNTINPANGAAASACSWVFKNYIKKPFFFKEPGFVVGVSATRPKVYFGGQSGYAAAFAARAWDWMPNYLRGMPETQLKQFAVDAGPLGVRAANTDSYFLDMRDELIYGDQFQNVVAAGGDPVTSSAHHILALPDANLNWKYPTEAMCKSFFVDDANGKVRFDGVASMNIRGFEVDYTRGNIAAV